MVQKRATD